MSDVKPGLYEHYKGGLYRVLFVARMHDSQDEYVVYVPLQRVKGAINPSPPQLRPLNKGDSCWIENVETTQAPSTSFTTPRFKYIGP